MIPRRRTHAGTGSRQAEGAARRHRARAQEEGSGEAPGAPQFKIRDAIAGRKQAAQNVVGPLSVRASAFEGASGRGPRASSDGQVEQDRTRARSVCAAQKAEARASGSPPRELSRTGVPRGAAAPARAAHAEGRIRTQDKGRASTRERSRGNPDDEVRSDIPTEWVPLWGTRVKRGIKGSPHQSRTEQVRCSTSSLIRRSSSRCRSELSQRRESRSSSGKSARLRGGDALALPLPSRPPRSWLQFLS